MDKCLHCGSDLVHVPGRRKKTFCNETCRSGFWYGKNKKSKPILEQFGDFANMVAINRGKAQKAAKKEIKAQSAYEADTAAKVPASGPRTLLEVKAMCPKELTGFERSQWIANERQKYGI